MMAEHHGLPVELLNGIFAKLHEDNPLSLVPLTLVCRYFYMLVVPLLYRNTTLDISKKDLGHGEQVHQTLAERLLNEPKVCAFVKELRVVDRKSYNGVWDNSSEFLASLLPRLTCLEVVRWEVKAFLPEAAFELMLENASRKRLRLHLNSGAGFKLENLRKCDKLLVHASHALCSLRIWFPSWYHSATHAREIKSRLFNTIRHCPNLRSFAVYGDGSLEHANDGVRLAVEPGDTLPLLQELSLIGNTPIFRREDLEIWGANGGWSNLQRVTFRDYQLLDGIHGCQDTLDSIVLTHVSDGFEQALGRICSRVDNLRELKMGGERSCVPIAALQRSGHSLRSLVILRFNYWVVNQVDVVGLEGLQLIQDHCPLVSSMALSIDRRPDSLLQDQLSILARFDYLEEISLDFGRHIESPESHWSQINEAEMRNVQSLFHYLIKHKRGRKLKSLTIYFGTHLVDWEHRVRFHNYSDFYRATIAPGVGDQMPEISVHRSRLGEI
ncbi:hypothetical protein BDR22DRAFT_712424 [Usnea florida]